MAQIIGDNTLITGNLVLALGRLFPHASLQVFAAALTIAELKRSCRERRMLH
jgi:hypothetical protein